MGFTGLMAEASVGVSSLPKIAGSDQNREVVLVETMKKRHR